MVVGGRTKALVRREVATTPSVDDAARAAMAAFFQSTGDDSPWTGTSIAQRSWYELTGEHGAENIPNLRARVQQKTPLGWLIPPPGDHWKLADVTRAKLLAHFGEGQCLKVSLRYKGNSLPGSVVIFDFGYTGKVTPLRAPEGAASEPDLASRVTILQAERNQLAKENTALLVALESMRMRLTLAEARLASVVSSTVASSPGASA